MPKEELIVTERHQMDEFSVLQHILTRRFSCRAFKPDAVPRFTIDRILETAQRTASWCNSQSWQVLLISGSALERFAEALYAHAAAGSPVKPDFAFPEGYYGIYKDRRRECGFALYTSIGIGHDDRSAGQRQMMENFRFFNAPHAAIITTEAKLGPYGAIDCGGYIANFLNAAQGLGIGAVPQAAIASYPDFIRRYFGMDADQLIVCAISLGYADHNHPINSFRTTRADVSAAVRFIGD